MYFSCNSYGFGSGWGLKNPYGVRILNSLEIIRRSLRHVLWCRIGAKIIKSSLSFFKFFELWFFFYTSLKFCNFIQQDSSHRRKVFYKQWKSEGGSGFLAPREHKWYSSCSTHVRQLSQVLLSNLRYIVLVSSSSKKDQKFSIVTVLLFSLNF